LFMTVNCRKMNCERLRFRGDGASRLLDRNKMSIDKSKLKDTMGRPLTQGLFIDFNYDDKYAVYTLDEEDKEYKGVLYPSLKKLYIACDGNTTYQIDNKHLLDWRHWPRLKENIALRRLFDKSRE